MATTTQGAVKLTYKDYCATPDDERYELLNGNLMMVPAPNMKHRSAIPVRWLEYELRQVTRWTDELAREGEFAEVWRANGKNGQGPAPARRRTSAGVDGADLEADPRRRSNPAAAWRQRHA